MSEAPGDSTYGQRPAMEDESMVGTLATQIEMIWPLERELLPAIGLDRATRVADLGCGTGEFCGRLARAVPHLSIAGIDLCASHLDRARVAYGDPRIEFVEGDARATPWDDASFDAVVVRHLLQAIGDSQRVLREATRILRPKGVLYVLAEDYAGILVDTVDDGAHRLFHDAAPAVAGTGTQLMHGRRAARELREFGYEDVHVKPLTVDTENTDRATFARMFRYWRDGYARFLAHHLDTSTERIAAKFDQLADAVEDPMRYGCWLLFAVWATRP